jgi:hypothetical protein
MSNQRARELDLDKLENHKEKRKKKYNSYRPPLAASQGASKNLASTLYIVPSAFLLMDACLD